MPDYMSCAEAVEMLPSSAEAKPEKGRSLTEDTMVCTTLQTDSSSAWH